MPLLASAGFPPFFPAEVFFCYSFKISSTLFGSAPASTRSAVAPLICRPILTFEVAIGHNTGFSCSSSLTIRRCVAGKFDLNIVTGDCGEDLPVSHSHGESVVLGVNADIETHAIAVLDGVMPTADKEQKDSQHRRKNKRFLKHRFFLSLFCRLCTDRD